MQDYFLKDFYIGIDADYFIKKFYSSLSNFIKEKTQESGDAMVGLRID